MALDEGTPVGWVSSVSVGDCAWCANLFIAPSHRRQGIARALLRRMLTQDKAGGGQENILLSSHTGAKLYPTIGYEMIGELLMFTPPKQTSSQ
jgi:GNAT superfamily N-acetyltransferase